MNEEKKPFSDPRWREWPGKGIKKFGQPNPKVKAFIDNYFKEQKKKHNK
ncbi:hypothetical protein HYQ59_0399 [Lactobacillus crispatus]|nr:hypothetical protein [Lactobacillus crispatus]MBD0968127.1 hypothetical protein [Lactobacillus crispatus]MBI1699053.1 hypothetical protein [Lactobacillus crispatus]